MQTVLCKPVKCFCTPIKMLSHHLAASIYLQHLLPAFLAAAFFAYDTHTQCQNRFCNDLLMFSHEAHCSQTEHTVCIYKCDTIALLRETALYVHKLLHGIYSSFPLPCMTVM